MIDPATVTDLATVGFCCLGALRALVWLITR